jgi:acetylornithine deacetylase/succinyl-diaminopimelate desuccinylase-like protein
MNYEETIKSVNEQFEKELIPGLSEFIKIDNLSPFFDAEWNTNGKLEKAANFILDWVKRQGVKGLKGEVIKDDDKSPLVFIEVDAHGSDKNILLYGHFDKQPHFTGWAEGLGPCIPVIRDGFLYGRGGADDGYAVFSSVVGLKTIQEKGGKHGRVVILIEGSEESGSPHLIPYINNLKDRIGSPDLMMCLDSGCLDYDRLWVTNSLRGCLMFDLTVDVLVEAVHSGVGTGLAPDSFMIIRNLLDRIEDSKTGKVIDALHVEIPSIRVEESKKVAELMGKQVFKGVKFLPGVKSISEDNSESILNSTWRPTVAITGASGLPDSKTAGNVLRSSTTVRVSIRLPPSYNSKDAIEVIQQTLTKDPPFNAQIKIDIRPPGDGWNNKTFSDKLSKSLNESSKNFWGKEYLSFGEGGSIPFIKQLADSFPSCEIVVIGVLGPNSNAHSCNEAMHIDYCKNITATLVHTIHDYSS